MKHTLVSTSNVKRHEAAAAALEPTLSDRDVNGLWLNKRTDELGDSRAEIFAEELRLPKPRKSISQFD